MNRFVCCDDRFPSDAGVRCGLAIAVVLVAGLSGNAAAAELVVRDLTVDVEVLPTDFSYSLTDASTSSSGNDGFTSNYGLAVGGLYSIAGPGDTHGFLVGAELTVAQATYQSIGHLTDIGLRLEGGYGYAFNDSLSFSAIAKAGYGISTFDLTANSAFPAFSSKGTFITYGLMLGADYTVNDNFLINCELGYMRTSDKLSGSGIDITLNNAGFAWALGISYRFSASPRPLE